MENLLWQTPGPLEQSWSFIKVGVERYYWQKASELPNKAQVKWCHSPANNPRVTSSSMCNKALVMPYVGHCRLGASPRFYPAASPHFSQMSLLWPFSLECFPARSFYGCLLLIHRKAFLDHAFPNSPAPFISVSFYASPCFIVLKPLTLLKSHVFIFNTVAIQLLSYYF